MRSGPAKEFQLHAKSQSGIGRWILLVLILCAAAWGFYI